MSGPLRKKRDHKKHKIPVEWKLDYCYDIDDIYDEKPYNDEIKHRLSTLKSHQHRLKKCIKQGKKVLSINGSSWSFHSGDRGFAYYLAGNDDEGKAAVEILSNNSFKTVYEARVAASLLGYEAYESGVTSMIIE